MKNVENDGVFGQETGLGGPQQTLDRNQQMILVGWVRERYESTSL